jgi:amidophosphoribosyltransferase
MEHQSELNEKCGVFGVSLSPDPDLAGMYLLASNEAAGITYNALLSLQHRGQQSAGIAAVSGNKIICHKDTGFVSDVFANNNLAKLPHSHVAIGHCNYSRKNGADENSSKETASPFVTDFLTGRVAVSHNGCITNAKEIRETLHEKGLEFNSSDDGEVISSLMAYCFMSVGNVLQAVVRAAKELRGAFSMVILCGDGKLIAVRDPYGYRPLCIGRNEYGMAVASESCALDCCGFEFMRDVLPGEVIMLENGQIVHSVVELAADPSLVSISGLCILEYVYFSRLDSIIDGLSVYEARFNMGRNLSREHHIDADIVCGIPDVGREIARGYSVGSGIRLVPGFVLNRYVGRSFIYPTQMERETAVRVKLNPLSVNVKDKRVVVCDDSMVRGTTISQAVACLRAAGAKEIHILIASPPCRYACHYGADTGDESTLIANKYTAEQICEKWGADSLRFISLSGLKEACKKSRVPFCDHCFTGSCNI